MELVTCGVPTGCEQGSWVELRACAIQRFGQNPCMASFAAAPKVIAFIVTRDRARAKAFYGDVLGFVCTGEDPFAMVFDLNGTSLRISTLEHHQPPTHTVLGWEVPDMESSVRALRAKGVVFNVYEGFGQDELGIWTAPGSATRVAWFLDPDGNNLSLTQF